MADWKDRLLPGSFRGIPFFIDDHELRGGRNAVNHEPVAREKTFAEDLGKKGQGYTLNVHILGDTYFFIRDSLIDAMEKKDPGILIHPYLGGIDVQPGDYSLAETSEEGRMARMSLSFTEAGDPNAVFAAINAITDFANTLVATVAAIENAFRLAVKVTGIPGFVIDSAKSLITGFATTIRTGLGEIRGNDTASLNKKIDDFEANVDALFLNPAALSSSVNEILTDFKNVEVRETDDSTIDTSQGRNDVLSVFRTMSQYGDTTSIPTNTPTRQIEKNNNQAIKNMINQLATVKFVEKAAEIEFASAEEAVGQRDEINSFIEAQLTQDIDDDLFQVLKDFKAKTQKIIPNPRSVLGTIKDVEQNNDIPSIVLAYDLYLSLDNEKDIINRNKVRNPAFISGDIEVLSGT